MIKLSILVAILLSYTVSFAQSVSKDSLKKELEAIYMADQQPKRAVNQIIKQYGLDSPQVDSIGQFIREIDSLNQLKIQKIINKHGWLGKSEVGDMANQTLFLIIQHCDIAIQERYLPLFRKSVNNAESNAYDLALMEDRILVSKGKKQRYGSQVKLNSQTNRYEVLPIEDIRNVDKRRKKMGLASLADYLKGFGIDYK